MKKRKPHRPRKRKRIAYLVCDGCGLVYLNNEATLRALAKPCPDDYGDDDD